MLRFMIAAIILCLYWKGCFSTAPIFNPHTCENGCRSQSDCKPNSACFPTFSSNNCGLCICTVGFSPRNGECVRSTDAGQGGSGEDAGNERMPPNTNKNSEETIASGEEQQASKRGQGSGGGGAMGASSEGNGSGGGGKGRGSNGGLSRVTGTPPPPSSQENQSGGGVDNSGDHQSRSGFDCNKQKCEGCDSSASSVQCPNLAGGGQCVLGSCLRVNSSISYCLCPFDRQSRTCHVKKSGQCNGADGKLPVDAAEQKGKRFRHTRDPESGGVLARHAVDTVSDCIRLCQWATYQQCRSINYGTINGLKICELLTVWASKDSILYQWLRDAPDWTYMCCFK